MQNAERKTSKRPRFLLHFAFYILYLDAPPTFGTDCLIFQFGTADKLVNVGVVL